MKFFCVTALLLAGLIFTARAQQEADDKYIGIYGLIQQADGLADTGDPGEAVAAFTDAQNQLQQLQTQYPNWNPNIVSFRLSQIADKIAEIKSRPAYVASVKKMEAAAVPAPAVTTPSASLPLPNESGDLQAQLQAAQAANNDLQAKLKEALSVQPAAVDPRELQAAQDKIRLLMKEVDLLKVSASMTSAVPATVETQFVTNLSTVFITNTLPPVTNVATVFVTNLNTVAVTNVVTNFSNVVVTNTLPPVTNVATLFVTSFNTMVVTNVVTNFANTVAVDTNVLAMALLDRAAAVKNFNDEHDRAEQLADELKRLQQNPGAATNNSDAALADLRAENDRLKAELAALHAAPPPPTGDDTLAAALKQTQSLVTSLQSEAKVAALEKIALQNRIQELATATNASVNTADYEARIQALTQERDGLLAKLNQAGAQNSAGTNIELTAQIVTLTEEVNGLRSRLAVLEASPVPYTDEELALLKTAVPPAANPDAEKKSISEMPAGTAELVASAQQHFAAQEFDAAEADYLKILDRDQNNGIALANLATIELQQGKLDDAEKHITAALAKAPDDAYNLSTLGYLKFRQAKYDDALKALSRAEQMDPNNPEIENYLGVALSHQGQRKAAETALRRAIQLNPNYAPAHNNLAVIYLSQTPPLVELARWHYEKALAAGQPRNPDLEKMLADKGAPVTP